MKPVSCDEMVIVNVVRLYRKRYTLGSRKRGVHAHAQPRPCPVALGLAGYGANVGEGNTVGQCWQYKAETPGP